MHTLNQHFADAHAAERRERLLASPKPRRSTRHRRSPWRLVRRIGDVVASRRATSPRPRKQEKRAHGRILEA